MSQQLHDMKLRIKSNQVKSSERQCCSEYQGPDSRVLYYYPESLDKYTVQNGDLRIDVNAKQFIELLQEITS